MCAERIPSSSFNFRTRTFFVSFARSVVRPMRVVCAVTLIFLWMHLNPILIEHKNCVNGKQSAAKFEYFIGGETTEKKIGRKKLRGEKAAEKSLPLSSANWRLHLVSGKW